MGIVYLVQNLINGKRYVGITKRTLEQRWLSHLSKVRQGSTLHFHCALRKYNEVDFHKKILEEIDDEKLLGEREKYYIALFGSSDPMFGYNLSLGGEHGELNEQARKKISDRMMGNKCAAGKKWTEEHRQNYIKARTGVSNGKGRKFSPEHRANISLATKGKIVSKETGAKISASKRGVKASDEAKKNIGLGHLGLKHSEETKAKMSAARKLWLESKKV